MKVTTATEVRTSHPRYVEADDHFFFDGFVFSGGTGKGNFDTGRAMSGAMRGKVKVTRLVNRPGRISLRSIGPEGNGLLVHVSADSKVVIDGFIGTAADIFDVRL